MNPKGKPYKIPSVEDLLDARVHFGHPSRRWHPAISPYIFQKTKGVCIFDLEETRSKLSEACDFLYGVAQQGGVILFVGLRKQSEDTIEEEAARSGAMFITGRWVGGIFTNFSEVVKNISKLKKLEEGLSGGDFDRYTKKERLEMGREVSRLNRVFGGVRNLEKVPQALVLASARKARTAVLEARCVGVPVVAVVDSNTDPRLVDYPIPGNDDSLKSLGILIGTAADAVKAGYQKKEVKSQKLKVKNGDFGALKLSSRVKSALEGAEIRSIEKLRSLSENDLLKIKGIGKKAVEELQRVVGS